MTTHIIKNDVSITGELTTTTIDSGTWTPNFGEPSNFFTPSSQTGQWTRIGQQIFFNAIVGWSDKGSAVSAPVVCTLPFTIGNSKVGGTVFWSDGVHFTNQIALASGAGDIFLACVDLKPNGGSPTNITANNCDPTGNFQMNGTYWV